MGEREQEVQRDVEGLAEVTEAFHEARAAAQGELTRVDVESVHVGADHETVCLEVEGRTGREWLLFESEATLHRGDLLDRFEGVSGLQALEGETWEAFFDREAGVVRASEGGDALGEIHPTEPRVEQLKSTFGITHGRSRPTEMVPFTEADRYGANVEEFDRLARVEAAMDGHPPGTEAELRVEGVDGDRVRAVAEIGGESFEWFFDVPGPNEFEDAALTRLVEAVDAGDPAGLDGHRVRVCLEAELAPGRTQYVCADGTVAIVPTSSGGEGIDVSDAVAAAAGILLGWGSLAVGNLIAGWDGMVLGAVIMLVAATVAWIVAGE